MGCQPTTCPTVRLIQMDISQRNPYLSNRCLFKQMTLSPFIHDIFYQQLFDLFLPHLNIYGLTNLILSLDSDYVGDDYIGCGVINCAKNPWLNRASLLGLSIGIGVLLLLNTLGEMVVYYYRQKTSSNMNVISNENVAEKAKGVRLTTSTKTKYWARRLTDYLRRNDGR
ncbi:hypothetical protein Cgig2_013774 [Carnegiea gigantea]|uniref:Uncharacterized protein n=1 Tax=Carnegiea gigantea TaxID=171969 RepID=A0A9Q1K8G9_9CARY|nr:hypothetical protein Cgig2_013774 [Carnegiea gigantea]